MTTPQIRALIAGRSRVQCEALAAALSQSQRVRVLGTASNPQEILARIGDPPADVVLVDFAMPDAARIVADVKQRSPGAKVVAITLGETDRKSTRLNSSHGYI